MEFLCLQTNLLFCSHDFGSENGNINIKQWLILKREPLCELNFKLTKSGVPQKMLFQLKESLLLYGEFD